MACLIRDKETGYYVGYDEYSTKEIEDIRSKGEFDVIPFYTKEDCKIVLGIKKSAT